MDASERARRLVELVLVSPGQSITRETACEALFPHLEAVKAATALRKSLSMARSALSALGPDATQVLAADRDRIWVDAARAGLSLEVDLDTHQAALRGGLALSPGLTRDERLEAALAQEGTLLEDEPYADWALRRREAIEALRQEARLALARDRARGVGRSSADAVVHSWESCLEHDPACEEAAAALMRIYSARGLRHFVVRTYDRCRAALEDLGLGATPALDQLLTAATADRGQRKDGRSPRQCWAPTRYRPTKKSVGQSRCCSLKSQRLPRRGTWTRRTYGPVSARCWPG